MNSISNILEDARFYYTSKIREHGATPAGVDWKCLESQRLRFEKLLEFYDLNKEFSINDIGCGYGALYDYLSEKAQQFNYYGLDISENMLTIANQRLNSPVNCKFISDYDQLKISDYSVASGIFNVKFAYEKLDWQSYILLILDRMNKVSLKGFSFNCLTSYSDIDYMREDLYYGDPCYFFDYCKKYFSKNISLIHDYDLYEFTIIVRKA